MIVETMVISMARSNTVISTGLITIFELPMPPSPSKSEQMVNRYSDEDASWEGVCLCVGSLYARVRFHASDGPHL
jgi:hypothetical protein